MTRERDEKGRFMSAKAPEAATRKARPRKKDRLAVFFRELSMFCNVSSALRKAGLAGKSRSIYDRLQTDPSFRARWNGAIAQSYALLELEQLERHRFGENRPPPRTAVEKRLRAVPTGQAMQLLRLHQSRARGAAAPPPHAARRRADRRSAREIRLEVERMLAEFNRRMGGEG